MAAVAVLASASTVVVAASDQWRSGLMQNRGPNSIWFSTDGAAAVATGVEVASGASVGFVLGPGEALRAIASTADQVTPLDTRVETAGFPG